MYQKSMFVLLAALAPAAAIAADTYSIDPNHTFPRFEYNHLGFSTHHGQFDKTTGQITLDRAAKTGSISITVDAASLNFGNAKFEEELRGDKFFDTGKFPTVTFTSNKVSFSGDTPVSAEGELTLHGVTKPLTLSISSVKCGPHPMAKKEDCGANVSGTLKRSDFGLGRFTPMVSDEVKLDIQVEALKN